MEFLVTKTFEDLGTTYLAGEKYHKSASIAERFIDAKLAVAVKMPARNSHDWLAARNQQEEERQKNIPADKREAAPSTVPTWGLRFLQLSRKYVVVKQSLAGEFTYGANVLYGGKIDNKQFVAALKKEGCPTRIIEQYLDAANAPDFLAAEAARIEADKNAAEVQRERERSVPKFI